LHVNRLRYICAAAPQDRAYAPEPSDPDSIARTATGRVLYACQSADVALPDCWTFREWRHLRQLVRDPGAVVVDHEDAVPGICCVSAPVWWPAGTCAGALTVVLPASKPPARLLGWVSQTARRISASLGQPERAGSVSAMPRLDAAPR
jgi:DNA-binding IclR family transcriptional regulator